MAAGAGAWVRPFRNGYRVYFRFEPGGVLHGKAGFATEEAAEEWAVTARRKITTRRRTVEDAIASYRADLDARVLRNELRATTAVQIEASLRRVMGGDALELPLPSLTPRRCIELYTALANTKGVAVGTHHELLKRAKTFGLWCVDRAWFKTSPWAEVKKLGERDDSRDINLRIDEGRKFRDKALALALKGDEQALSALIVLMCSCSPHEVVQLTGRDVDNGGAVLWIAGARLKTKNRKRQIDVVDEKLRALLLVRKRAVGDDALLFNRNRNLVTEACKRISKVAGVPVVDARAVRRTFATLDARRGSSLDSLAFNMGHGADGKAKTAQRHYVQAGAAQSGAAKRVLGVLDGGKARKRAK